MKFQNASCSFALLMGIFGSYANVRGHNHHRNHDHLHAHSDHSHRIASSLASDFSASGRADVFDSCLIACYDDIVSRYGKEFAEYLRNDGFVFETCHSENVNATDNQESTAESRRKQRSLNRILGATNQLTKLWSTRGEDGKVHIPVKVKSTSAFDQETLDTIEAAMQHIEDSTGVIKFINRTDEQEYIYFSYESYYANVCASNLGKQTNTSTKIYLGWCREYKHKGNIIHEIVHALGFWHEHSRPDRDNYIKIEWDNVVQGAEVNLEKAQEVNSLGSAYDYSSIMHYPQGAYAINSTMPTIKNTTVINKWETMGQRVKLSDRDIDQLRLLYQCKSGPRPGAIGINELCSKDCRCWEHAIGECTSDEECMGDLVCGDTPNPLPTPEYNDKSPPYPFLSGTILCDEYCHTVCCKFPDNVVECPETCDTAPPVEPLAVVPLKMCIKDPNGGVTTTSTTGATASTTTTTATTTTTTSNPAKWYVDWSISKCVQSCVGPAPCGGVGQYVVFHDTVQQCCSAHLYWMSFSNCNNIPSSPMPSKRPTFNPTAPPTKHPVSGSPSTLLPSNPPTTGKPVTAAPSSKPVTNSPSKYPTSNTPTTNQPSKQPTLKPSGKPTTNSAEFYVDWNISKCVQDCIGPAPCGGYRPAWSAGYKSVEVCCSTMAWKPFAECSYVPVAPLPTRMPTTKSPGPPSRKPSVGPTSSPTFRSPTLPPLPPPPSGSTSSQPTYKPTSSQPTGVPTTYSPSKKPTIVSTPFPTFGSPSRKPTQKPTFKQTDKPTLSAGDTRWYPGASKCLNDGNAPSWMANFYLSQTTCCSSHFSWDYNNCLGVKQQPTYKWYANWSVGKCVQDCETSEGGSCGGLIPGSYVLVHTSAEGCCSAHMSYLSLSQCKYY